MNSTRQIFRSALIGLFAMFACFPAGALESNRTIDQFTHTAWHTNQGAPAGTYAITQTKDGYLWLASDTGPVRFDGTTFEHYEPQSGPALPSTPVNSFLALPNGDLWIGYFSGEISLLRSGRVQNYSKRDGLSGGVVMSLAQDRTGTIWAATYGGLARLDGTQWKLVGKDWNFPGKYTSAIFVDRKGTLWVSTENALVFLPQGSRTFQATSIHIGPVSQFAEAPNGKLWMAELPGSVRPVPLGSNLLPSDEAEVRVGSQGFLFAREGDLWITSIGDGINRVRAPEQLTGKYDKSSGPVENLMAKNGLTAGIVYSIFEDREGNIWVGTFDGVDRFRKKDLVSVTLPVEPEDPILVPGDSGDIWAFLRSEQLTGKPEQIFHIGKSHAEEIKDPLNPNPVIDTAFRNHGGPLTWISGTSLTRYENEHIFRYPLPKCIPPMSFFPSVRVVEDHAGVLWLAAKRQGLFYRDNGTWNRLNTPPDIAKLTPRANFLDDSGNVWFGYEQGAIIEVHEGKLQTLSTSEASPVEGVWAIQGRNRHVWIGGGTGLVFFDHGKFEKVIPVDSPRFGRVSGIEELADGSLWLCETRGVIHIDTEEVRNFLQSPSYRVHYEIFDSLDGLPGNFNNDSQTLIEGSDGRLWFGTTGGIAWLNPADIQKNQPPPASIRSVNADDKRLSALDNLILPPHTTNVQIEYAALNLSTPERVHFRYNLEGTDKGWQEAEVRREAHYTNLGPGKYKFRVSASNEGGKWSDTYAMLEFSIAPAWFQTIWFRALCVCVMLLLLWVFYQIRLRQLERQFNMTLVARVDERTRIARDLHDTLLQSFQGLTLHFQRALNLLPERAPEAIQTLSRALDGAEQAIIEGRDAIHDLRSPASAANVLAEKITAFGEGLAARGSDQKEPVQFRMVVEGSPRALSSDAYVDIFRIARESLRNSFSHSQGHLIETELAYTESQFRLRVRDDGKGIDPDERVKAERSGHWGLKGMRERAERLGGELEVWSEPGAGTEIELKVPASIAYEATPSQSSSWVFWRRKKSMMDNPSRRQQASIQNDRYRA